jgi:hypothetical protein
MTARPSAQASAEVEWPWSAEAWRGLRRGLRRMQRQNYAEDDDGLGSFAISQVRLEQRSAV